MARTAKPFLVALAVLVALTAASPATGQELDCRVQIDRSQLSGSDFSFLEDLQRQVEEYLNARSWTDDQFQSYERISCSLQIVFLESISLSEFRTRLVVTVRRPIYGTSQSTVVARINDPEWQFEYGRGTSLPFDLDRYNSLTSLLDFYAYLILGYDYDTFSPLGGTPHFEEARAVAGQAEGSGDPGWSSVGTQRNRAQLISDLLSERHQPLRRASYQYHRKGLDRFLKAPEAARKTVLEALRTLEKLNRNLSRSYPLDLFFATKSQELTALFANSGQSSQAHSLLTNIDPAHSSEYSKLVE